MKTKGSATLCIAGMLIAGLSVLGNASRPTRHGSGFHPVAMLTERHDASIDVRNAFFVAGLQLLGAISGLVVARAISRWSDAG
jgi:hypothetical protein